jgi:hypothetical protein
MRKIISFVLVLLPMTAFAAADCRVVEYPDHSEAICVENGETAPALTQASEPEQIPGQEEALASPRSSDSEVPDVPPEMIVMNGLTRSLGPAWIKSITGQ